MSTLNQAFSTGGGLATEATLLDVLTEVTTTASEVTSIDAKTPALGQALAAASVPVVLTAAQVSTLTPQTNALTDAELRATPVPVSGPLTDAQLRAVAVPVSGPLTDAQLRAVAVPISAAALPLPTGAATEATLASIDIAAGATAANTQSIDGKLGTLGQKAMTGSAPVVIASNQSAIPVNVANPVAGAVTQAGLTVGTSAVRLTVDAAAPDADRRKLVFRPSPDSSAKFAYGGSGVTIANGIPVFPGESVEMEYDSGDYYIISDAASQTVFVMEQE